MKTDKIIPLTIHKTSAPQFLTFNCNKGQADLQNLEGCTPPSFYNAHTYDLAIRMGPDVTGIAGTVLAGSWITGNANCTIDIKDVDDETWQTILTFTIKKNETKQFECYPPYPTAIGMFRITFDQSGAIISSQGIIQIGQTPANQQPTKPLCENAGGYWYNNSCHLIPPLCGLLDNETDCNAYNCYWANGACHPYPTSCEDWLTEQDCTNNGCSWWGTSNPYLPDTCHDPTMVAKKLSMSPDDPADMYSTTPPGSLYAEFQFSERIKIFQGFGQVRIGGAALTYICFWLDSHGDLWRNRVKLLPNNTRPFDENFRISEEYNRMGSILRIGVKGSTIPVEYLNMVLIYRPAPEVALITGISYPTSVIPKTDVPIKFTIINSSSQTRWLWFELRVNNIVVSSLTFGSPGGIGSQFTRYTGALGHTSKFTITYGHEDGVYPAHGNKITDGVTPEYTIEVG